MKKIVSILAFVTTIILAGSFNIKDIGNEDNHFPYLVSKAKNRESIADMINIYLHLTYFEILPDGYSKNPFKTEDDEFIAKFEVASYNVTQNSKFIHIEMDTQFCGAYCEGSKTRDTFLADSGQHIKTEVLFTPQGLKEISKINREKVLKKIRDFLKNGSGDREQNRLYEECLEDSFIGKIHGYSNFNITKKFGLTLYSPRCSNHAMMALDDLGEFSNNYSLDQIDSYLSDLGKYLLDNRVKIVKKSNDIEGIYSGKISNKYSIMLFIKYIDNNRVNALYWYEKYKKLVELSGYLKDNRLKLIAQNKDDKDIEIFIGDLKNRSFSGEWINLEDNRSLKFKVVK